MKSTVVFVLTICCGLTFASFSSDCGSEVGTVNSVTVSGCSEDDDRCTLKRNTDASVEINFTPKKDIDVVKAVVHGILLDIPVPFHLTNDNGCVNSGLTCPLKAGQTYLYKATLPVLKKYPQVTVTVKWELTDQDKKDITCTFIAAKIR
ncbi:ecdysteroid-regulated 16 kDa protein-like isoform X2 [Agrilus planipennis]|uniref:Ecdysteroid-regulated 16 kDa protein-like isoform X1 n=1 Tax=Agrilus planipennis TaxID=224129 RepID=A0A1W4WIQ1_AGRPL|nr:ecdysteroid-regulated 16 kDa protein-like isoform X1 [Agrilus planipennis]XP_025831800.1 ecdysteroid-regulated 16 kDa protein-like isoform X2 [Agrilus planipennis]